MRAVARNEMELDPASVPCQPLLNQGGMVVPGIVEKDMNASFRGIHHHDRIKSAIVLAASTVVTSIMRVAPVSRSMAP